MTIGQSTIETYTVEVSEKTTWVFQRLMGPDGVDGVGESTVNALANEVVSRVAEAPAIARGAGPGRDARLRAITEHFNGVVGRAIASGFEQAWLDREGKRCGRPLFDLLGGAYRTSVPCYANINRGTLTRSGSEFAERALAAEADGYRAVKLAPFDNVTPEGSDDSARTGLVEAGVQRVGAVRDALDGRLRIMVDCHSRLRIGEADLLMRRLAAQGVDWLEEPLAETPAHRPHIANLRQTAGTLGISLAGAEKAASMTEFLPFLVDRCYDVVMPDIVLAGGPCEVMRIGHLANALETAISLHNPCGPVMDIHSAHVAAALPCLMSLERQYRETPLYEEIVRRKHVIRQGQYHLADCPGAGIEVDWSNPVVRLQNSTEIEL